MHILAKQQVMIEELERWHLDLLREYYATAEEYDAEVEGNFEAITEVIGWVRYSNPDWRPSDSEHYQKA